MSSFNTLFTVKFYHEYYGSFTVRDLQVDLSDETRLIFSRFRLLFRRTQDGFVTLFQEDISHHLENLKEEILLSFVVRPTNRHFANFTKISTVIDSGNSLFTNKSPAIASQETNHHPFSLGVVDICLGGPGRELKDMLGSEFEIRFENRSVHWIYYFVLKEIKLIRSIVILTGDQQIAFASPEHETLVNGQIALKVSSLEAIPLQSRYQINFTAHIKRKFSEGGSVKVVKSILPTPDITKIKAKVMDGVEQFYSEMYVYV